MSTRGRLARRLVQLYGGLALYGASSALLVRSGLGLEPWNVLHQGLAEKTGLSIGVVLTLVGAAVLLAWIPLRQRPGLGTISNVLVIGAATGLYIAARFGPGPRDGLMTGLHQLSGVSIRLVRTGIELTVVATGFALGGTVGIGTLLYALAIGPLAQAFLRVFAVPPASGGSTAVATGQPRGAILRP